MNKSQLGALKALLDAVVERKRAVFFTGHVLVEFDRDFIPAGPITMVCDEEDIKSLEALELMLVDLRNLRRRAQVVVEQFGYGYDKRALRRAQRMALDKLESELYG